ARRRTVPWPSLDEAVGSVTPVAPGRQPTAASDKCPGRSGGRPVGPVPASLLRRAFDSIPMRQRRWEDVKSQSSRLHGNRIGSPWEEQEATDVLVPEIEGVVGRFYECPAGLSSARRTTILAAPSPGEAWRAGRQRVRCERGRRAVRTLACRGRRGQTP